jgi:hypothetical protein
MFVERRLNTSTGARGEERLLAGSKTFRAFHLQPSNSR